MTIVLLLLMILLVLVLGGPLFTVLLAATMIGFFYADVELPVIGVELYRLVDTPFLSALPLFTFAGYLVSASRTSQRLLQLAQTFFGWMPDGLAIVALTSCAFFTAFTGASGVTILALGALLLPAMQQAGYSERYSLGLVTTSGSLGLLLPPSLPLILYGIIIQQMNLGFHFDFKELFLAGILPGLLMIAALAGWSLWANRKRPVPLTKFSATQAKTALRDAAWEIPLPVFILVGIFGGFFAVSEVAAMTALYVLVVEVFIYKEVKLSELPKIMTDSMMMVGAILLILAIAMAFTNFLIDVEVPDMLFAWIRAHVDNKYTFLLLLNLFLLVLGALLDIFSALVIAVPLIVPVAMGFGIHPLHLGVIFLANMQIGYFTPPVGMNLFIASYRFNRSITTIYHATIPFMMVLLATLLVITYWPWLTLVFIDK